VTEYFSVDDLHHVRVLVERACAAVGMSAERIYRLVSAVNEIAINAVKYAGGGGVLTVRQTPHGVSVEVSDRGPGLPEALPTKPPSVDATAGRGLWIARRQCPDMTVNSSPDGVRVRFFMAVG
jgi:anti-sigma regulatory factor (Ser/Thr protein kinase)